MLDNLELPQVQEVATYDRRALSEHKPPGMAGSLLQNLGRRPASVVLWGVATGPDARDFAEKLDQKFRAGKPVPFTADIVADAKIDQVLIDDLRLQEVAGKPERFAYVLILREFIKPVEPEDVSQVNTDAAADALRQMKDLVNGLTTGFDILKQVSTFASRLTTLNQQLKVTGVKPRV
jgi:hypothetical protein